MRRMEGTWNLHQLLPEGSGAERNEHKLPWSCRCSRMWPPVLEERDRSQKRSSVCEELGKEARTWPETQVMHRKKTSALFPEWAFYHQNKTRFFLLKARSALLKTRFYGHFVNYSCR